MREEGGAAHRCLAGQSVTAEKTRETIAGIVGTGLPGLAPPQGLTPRAKRVIENAVALPGQGVEAAGELVQKLRPGGLLPAGLGDAGASSTPSWAPAAPRGRWTRPTSSSPP